MTYYRRTGGVSLKLRSARFAVLDEKLRHNYITFEGKYDCGEGVVTYGARAEADGRECREPAHRRPCEYHPERHWVHLRFLKHPSAIR
jgi:hypothetical protein